MMEKEEYKRELVRMWDSVRKDCKGENYCRGISQCEGCQFYNDDIICDNPINAFEMIETIEEWSNEHHQKHKISKLEYDILKYFDRFNDCSFNWGSFLLSLMEKGYFKGATKDMLIKDYLKDCEVSDNV